ncbi:hypothetical protein BV898_16968 [Hypsibius exemplaris]|uniref:Uncharacterized protein n=1 Tax=Hypsibius exemplaris TaxID=2072580 RepID=A0A9X6NH26_HYPEX|nr:hypothetical protein BV898_16968 [Hypsibius exemplaris]
MAFPNRIALFLCLIESLLWNLGHCETSPTTENTTTPSGPPCSIPLNPPAVLVNPEQLAGKRYIYLSYKGIPSQLPPGLKNSVNYYTVIGDRSLDGTPGGVAINATTTLRAGPASRCLGFHRSGMFTNNGEKNVFAWVFGSDKPGGTKSTFCPCQSAQSSKIEQIKSPHLCTKLAGKRYIYMSYKGIPSQLPPGLKNSVNYYTVIGDRSLDGTPGGVAINATTTYEPVQPLVYYSEKILFTDSKTVEIWYHCFDSDLAANLCKLPYVEVNVDRNPNAFTADEKTALLTRVDAVLAPYGCSSTVFATTVHDDTLAECVVAQDAPAQFLASISGLTAWAS